MAECLKLKRFTNVAILKRIHFPLLLEFLDSNEKFRTFLADRKLVWTTDPDRFDYERLAGILISPDVDTPAELLDALYFVDNLADADHNERIIEECQEAGLDLGADDLSPEDLTLRAWLADPDILERVHAEKYRIRPKRFESYYTACRHPLPDLDYPSAEVLVELEKDLNEWFTFKKKGRGARVFPFPRNDGFWFLVRHGQQLKREGTVEASGDPGRVFYRPEKFDVLVYYPDKGELAIYTETKGERKAYCQYLGKHLFGDPQFFQVDAAAKYTLTPLIDQGRDALVCSDIEGVQHVRLYELHIDHNSDQMDTEVRKARDVFSVLERHNRDLRVEQPFIELIKAKFKVTFDGGLERTVVVEPPNVASFDREADSDLVHDWLCLRNFICNHNTGERADGGPDQGVAAG